jgi:hypothetical protein
VCKHSGLILHAALSRDQPAFQHMGPLEAGRSRATMANQPPVPRPQPLEHPLEVSRTAATRQEQFPASSTQSAALPGGDVATIPPKKRSFPSVSFAMFRPPTSEASDPKLTTQAAVPPDRAAGAALGSQRVLPRLTPPVPPTEVVVPDRPATLPPIFNRYERTADYATVLIDTPGGGVAILAFIKCAQSHNMS